jgi:formiminotetrahydrofolate cyclodeaminase
MDRLDDFIESVAAAEPLPGGGSVAALAGSLAAALGEMMSGLTEGRNKFAAVELQVREIHAKLKRLRNDLRLLVQEDSAAFKSLLDAIKLPRNTDEEKIRRDSAIERAARWATETPIRTARAVSEVLEHLNTLIEIGNANAICDAAVGAQLAYASLKGAQYNILANIAGLRDISYSASCREEISNCVQNGKRILQQIEEAVSRSRF